MRALTVQPKQANSCRLEDLPEADPTPDQALVETLAIGICGTDREIVGGDYGEPPSGEERLVLGHESLGRVLRAPESCGLSAGDLAVAIVRQPDPIPCPNCAVGEWDMCRNGKYKEHGIKQLHGFCRERFCFDPWFLVRLDPSLTDVGVLIEPASIVAKAWEHIDRIGSRARWVPNKVLVTGAGPVGLLAALMGKQRDLEVHVLDKVTTGPKPDLVKDLGAHYHTGSVSEACHGADIVIECTGVGQLVLEAMQSTAPNGIVCLTGISSGKRSLDIDMASLNRTMVLENDVVFGSVNANRRHYDLAAKSLTQADRSWLARLLARREPLEQFQAALEKRDHDVKTIIEFDANR